MNFLWMLVFFLSIACVPSLENLKKYQTSPVENSQNATQQEGVTIQQLSDSQYKIPANALNVWDALVEILIHNYNFSLLNKELGILTTEWDSYYVGQDIYRNKVSIHLRSLSNYESTIAFRNNVEALYKTSPTTYQPVWVPSEDKSAEIKRILGNLASMLNLKSPRVTSEDSRPPETTPRQKPL